MLRKELMKVAGNVTLAFEAAGYGVITLHRPEKHNAISKKMTQDLNDCLEKAKQKPLKFLVLTGFGDKMFCSGGDLYDLHGDLSPDEAFSILYPMKEVLYKIVAFPVPVICLLNGNALGGGCEIATACDIRIAKESTTFGFVQSTLGIVPGWGGGVLLYEKVHHTFAFQWLLEGAIYSTSYLMEKGWIQQVVDKSQWSDPNVFLQPYILKSVDQMKLLKAQYKKKLSALALNAEMNAEVRSCATLWDSPEHKQAVHRFMHRK